MAQSAGVTVIVHVIGGLGDGGAEGTLYRLCRADQDIRHHVISFMGEEKYGPLLEASGVPVDYLDMPRGDVTIKGLYRLWRILRQLRPCVVQTWMYHSGVIGGFIAKLAGVRLVYWNLRRSSLDRSRISGGTMIMIRMGALLSRWLPSGIVCCAQSALDAHAAIGYSRRKLVLVPNGYDVDAFKPDSSARTRVRTEWGVADGMPLLGMVGRFDPHKNHRNLLRALGRLKQTGLTFRCALVGRGMTPDNRHIADWLVDYNLDGVVCLPGSRTDIPAVMNALDIHVLSSDGEGFPNVVAEAMACGTPCVSTDSGDAAEIIGATGWIVPTRDAEALAGALRSAIAELADQEEWIRRQADARTRIVEHFDVDRMIHAYHAVWAGPDA